jgi:predicted ferric reductase
MKVSELWVLVRYKLGWAAIILLTIIPSLRVFTLLAGQDIPFDAYAILSTLGQVTGIAGLMLYAINLILAMRIRIMENYFGGLNRMYIAHHLTGGIALILLSFHPILLALRLLVPVSREAFRYAAEFLWVHPISFKTPIGNDMAINFGIIALLGMVVLLILTFFIHLPYRVWLLTHKFLGAAFFFAGLHVLFIKGSISGDGFLRWYLIFWSLLGILAAVYKTLIGRIVLRHYNYHVKSVSSPSKDVVSLILTPVDTKMDFQPGQFVFIRFRYSGIKGITSEAHPFSISSSPSDSVLRLSVKALGDYTKELLQIKPGAIAEIEGAYGKFSYKNYDNPNQIWIAGGIGITPFLSMARSLESNTNLSVDLYYSVKVAEEMIEADELTSVMAVPTLKFNFKPHIADKDGFLTADTVEKGSKGLADKDFYLCGPPPMMKALRKQLRAKGVPNFRIHSEEFSMS